MNILSFVCQYCLDLSPQSSQLAVGTADWWAQVESNHRPHAYQACALTFWAMSPCYLHISGIHLWSSVLFLLNFTFRFFNRWWRWRDSNPWPPACRAGALPTELHPQRDFPTVPGNRTTTISNFVLRRLFCFFVSYERSYFNLSCSP